MRFLLTGLLGLGMMAAIACGGNGDDNSGNMGGGGTAGASGSAAPTSPPAASGSSGSALQDACSLLDEAEVNAALGDDELAQTRSDPPTQALSVCQWEGSNTGNRYVYLTLRTAQNAMTVFENNYRSAAEAVAIDGVGDEAFALPGTDTPNNYRSMTAAALTSSLYIQVLIAGPNRSDAEALGVLTTVMQQVVSRLE